MAGDKKPKKGPDSGHVEPGVQPHAGMGTDPDSPVLAQLNTLLELDEQYSIVVSRRDHRREWQYLETYRLPLDENPLAFIKREHGGGEYRIRVQYRQQWAPGYASINVNIAGEPKVSGEPPPAPPAAGQGGSGIQEILEILKQRVAVQAARAAIEEKSTPQGLGGKEILEMMAAMQKLTPNTIEQVTAIANALGLKSGSGGRGPYDEVIAQVLAAVIERGMASGEGEGSWKAELVRQLVNPDTIRELGRTIGGTIAAATSRVRIEPGPGAPPPSAQAPGQIPVETKPPEAAPAPVGAVAPPHHAGLRRLLEEILAMVAADDRDYDHALSCADRWTPGFVGEILSGDTAVQQITAMVPQLGTDAGRAWLEGFCKHAAEADAAPDTQEGEEVEQ